ncbi:type I glyceraldehyde-3-phosphate dehydrogenase [Hahella ganghwensis]|uniref:type I glyceraldehyde-3-phosphate dehydrogenase n=1 Tax=Hahella ganghwensis TaxID=286420 RepID=UPI000364562B|nr:type I glyceraldehyde-3-phosphate dehydrogenase [Hahella ganghwensis]
MIRIGINGFGRIGRNVLRAIYESGYRDMMQVVAINDLAERETCAHLLEFDSLHGRFNQPVKLSGDLLEVGSDAITLLQHKEPLELPWAVAEVDLVMECTGRFNSKEKAQAHIAAGAKKVLVSAPCKNADATVVYGVNEHVIESGHQVISNASCTTNCLAPVAKVIHENFGIEGGVMTTIHSYTNDQNLLDLAHPKDLCRARAAAMSMIPTKTGAAQAIGMVLPGLEGRLSGMSVRVPTPNVSLVDLSAQVTRETTREEINEVMRLASLDMHVLEYNDRPLVSCDFNHNPASAIFDANHTQAHGHMIKVLAWYDNEWGFSNRMLDTALTMMSA